MNQAVITWKDAVFYHLGKIPVGCTDMETVGTILKETDKYILVGDSTSVKLPERKPYPETGNPKYFLIPKGMIQNIYKEGK
jgi:hypothetical protein